MPRTVDGWKNKRITLNPLEETVIDYKFNQDKADIFNFGPGEVYFTINEVATLTSKNTILLLEGMGYEFDPPAEWKALHLISDGSPIVQVVVKA